MFLLCSVAAAPSTPPAESVAMHSAAMVLCDWCLALNDWVPLVAKKLLQEELKPTTSSDKSRQFTLSEYRRRMKVNSIPFFYGWMDNTQVSCYCISSIRDGLLALGTR